MVRRAVVIGAGFIGLEFAGARKHGIEVTLLEYADRPMARALTSVTGAWFRQGPSGFGTELRWAQGVASFESDGSGHVAAAVSTTPAVYLADLVLAGISACPLTDLAAAVLRTSYPNIFALGDCASYPGLRRAARVLGRSRFHTRCKLQALPRAAPKPSCAGTPQRTTFRFPGTTGILAAVESMD